MNKQPSYKWIDAKFDGRCAECGDDIESGDRVLYDPDHSIVYCEPCGEDVMDESENIA